MKTTQIRTQSGFKKWAANAVPGEVAVYHRSDKERNILLFQTARDLFHKEHLVVLYQHRREDGLWEHCAQRVSGTAAGWLNKMSAAIRAPYNPHAHENLSDGVSA